MNTINCDQALAYCTAKWDESILPALSDYIRIPNQSPDYDPEWATNGYMDQAVELMVDWVKQQDVAGIALEVVKEEGRTPLIFATIDASPGVASGETVLLYAHLDKQPPMTDDWSDGLGPHTPVVRDGRLFGRGGADDGYGIFASVTAIKALQEQGIPHSRCVVLVEASEESSSVDLPYYVDQLSERIGAVDFVVCLDSGASDLEHLWSTTSLRGAINVNLTVGILNDGVHSGAASGIVPDSFRIARKLVDRVENAVTGEVLGAAFHADIPAARLEQAAAAGAALGDSVLRCFPWVSGAGPMTTDPTEAILAKTWKPTLTVTGADGLPPSAVAGNVLRASTTLKLSFRLPPTVDSAAAAQYIRDELTRDPPYGAVVTVDGDHAGSGWNAPPEPAWQLEAMHGASRAFYGNDAMFLGEGWSIPFMGMLGERYPSAGFMVAGVLDGSANAHGPDESFDIGFAKKLTASVSYILASHAAR
ncbi:succinyl-diaminopimelate desuccinylase [Thecamonas trahens ATCC 50062]|uniref:Succinyl-diaminopimelate desuccinylase n=1 Tax=Thecamonas trahens ATCC 50062 TaxID=461836 RepID=A0A0L0D549_THETB|nr:succinyl-diaminopimelate desuccinylase [Thecamonas trahens ATCC 50062]KNC47492.1 succinyl-diaminopimelate desuccinylase [Thecamonas trahens ATCC 50062]|eukprot:XP_013759428.1 succinyl-diaminopimelate desuccinylase [Thecamonas trahens ATCC 50062]